MQGGVFKQDLNWTSFQDKQYKLLENLDKSLQKTLSISRSIDKSLLETSNNISNINNYNKANLTLLEVLTKELVPDYTKKVSAINDIMGNLKISMSDTREIVDDLEESIEGLDRATEDFLENSRRSEKSLSEDKRGWLKQEFYDRAQKFLELNQKEDHLYDMRTGAIHLLKSKLIDLFSTIAKTADNYSEISNSLVRTTEASGSAIRDFRSDIVKEITEDLNRDTGYYYDPIEVYKQMAVISQSGIGDLDVLKDVARPAMLAWESMDINIHDLTTLLGRWNTRYNFSSIAMEEMVNDIRGYTAGNQATAEATMQNLTRLDNWMAYYANGDEESLSAMSESIARGTAWLESMNVDTARYTEYLADIASGSAAGNPQLIQLLNKSGLSPLESQELFKQGQVDKLYESLFNAEYKIVGELKDIDLKGQTASARGMNIEELIDTFNAANSENFKTLAEFELTKSDATAADSVKDKYIDKMDQINNWLHKIYSNFSNWQEKWGIGIDDIMSAVTAISTTLMAANAFSGGKVAGLATTGLSKIGSLLGVGGSAAGGMSLTSIGSSILGALSTAGPVVLGLGALLVVGKGIKATVDNIKKNNEESFKNLNDIAKSINDDKMTMMQEKITINDKGEIEKSYNLSLVDKSEFDQAKHEANMLAAYNQDKKNSTWIQKIGRALGFTTSAEKEYIRNQKATEFMNSLDSAGKQLFAAYNSRGLVTSLDQLEFLIDNFDKISALSEQGLAVELSKKGLKSPIDRKTLLGYAEGTNYITGDQIALLHEGEAVTPKRYNPAANMNELESLREYVSNNSAEYSREYLGYLSETAEILSEIKEFLSFWKEDNTKRDLVSEAKSKFSRNSAFTSNYLMG